MKAANAGHGIVIGALMTRHLSSAGHVASNPFLPITDNIWSINHQRSTINPFGFPGTDHRQLITENPRPVDPQHLKFARSHEWVALNGNEATIGISDFAVHELTDLVFIQLPAVGRKFQQGESFGEVESVKAVSDLYAPCAGEITAVNTKLIDDLGPLSSDPFGAGWIIKLKVDDPAQLGGLMDYAAYQRFCEAEAH